LLVSGNDWRRHNKEMDHRGRVPPILAGKRNRTLDPNKTTLASSVIAQTVGLNAEKRSSVRSRRGDVSLDIPFYRTIRMVAGRRNQSFIAFNHFRKPCNHPNLYAAAEIRESCV
jgi:hypothetical protein